MGRPSAYAVGDLVVITQKTPNITARFVECKLWVEGMSRAVGEIGTIRQITPSSLFYLVSIPKLKKDYWFYSGDIAPLNDDGMTFKQLSNLALKEKLNAGRKIPRRLRRK